MFGQIAATVAVAVRRQKEELDCLKQRHNREGLAFIGELLFEMPLAFGTFRFSESVGLTVTT